MFVPSVSMSHPGGWGVTIGAVCRATQDAHVVGWLAVACGMVGEAACRHNAFCCTRQMWRGFCCGLVTAVGSAEIYPMGSSTTLSIHLLILTFTRCRMAPVRALLFIRCRHTANGGMPRIQQCKGH